MVIRFDIFVQVLRDFFGVGLIGLEGSYLGFLLPLLIYGIEHSNGAIVVCFQAWD